MRNLFFYWLVFLGICHDSWGQVDLGQSAVGHQQSALGKSQGKFEGRKLSAESQTRMCLVKVALGQTHVRERTGRNDGLEVRKYLKILHLPEGTPYCGAFVEWVYRQCGINSNVQAPAVAYSWAKYPPRLVWNKGAVSGKKSPQMGDVAVFGWRQRAGGVRYHCELVAEWQEDEEVEDFVTIGANTSAPIYVKVKGEGVHKKLRQKEEAVVANHISGSLEAKPRPLVNPFVTL